MADDKQIQQWLKEGTITQAQARKMLVDSSNYKKEERSNKLIVAVSTIGAILLGIGAVLFMASNWETIPDTGKVLLFLAGTFGTYYLGYVLRYQKQNLPKVGEALLFLGAWLFGATVLLMAQVYQINTTIQILVFIWLIGILPLVYVLKNQAIAGLASLLFFLWLGAFVSEGSGWHAVPIMNVLFLIGATMLFAIGGLHYFRDDLAGIGEIYRIVGLKVVMIGLFLLTFAWFSKSSHLLGVAESIPTRLTVGLIGFAIIAIMLTIVNWFFNKSEKISRLEGPAGLGLVALALIFYYYPSESSIYVLVFNGVLAGVIGALIYLGYQRERMELVNMGTFWLSAFIIARYFDWFWGLLPRSLFFMSGGLIMVLGGIVLEKKRRQIKQGFGAKEHG